MATTIEYALFAANVYGNSSLVRKERNTPPYPDGWTALPNTPTPANDAHWRAAA